MSTLYDSLPFNMYCEFDTPFREGVGVISQDVSKNHSVVTLVNTPTWSSLDTGLGYLTFDGTTEYAEAQSTDTGNLDFTTGDYSLAAWINITDNTLTQIIMGRYELNVSGWELYWLNSGGNRYMTLRHHHAGGTAERSACYSLGWTESVWTLCGISRTGGGDQVHYRNGVEVDVTGNASLEDIETETRDLTIGVRYSKDANYYKGGLYRPRCWSTALTADDWLTIYELEKGWFA